MFFASFCWKVSIRVARVFLFRVRKIARERGLGERTKARVNEVGPNELNME